jgi:hypothetical protein
LRGKDQKSPPAIEKVMNRTYQSVKNHNNRDFQTKNEIKHEIEYDSNEMEKEMLEYQDDCEFYGISCTFKGCKSLS